LNFKSTITGIAASAILLAVLAVARLITVESNVPDLEVREIETVTIAPPPPPPPNDEPLPDTPPPPPALTTISFLQDPTRIPIPQAQVPMDITAPVENFFSDLPPAPLPSPPKQPSKKLRNTGEQFFKNEENYRTTPVEKSHYSASELDGTPRLLRHGSASFPSALARQGIKSGTVVLEVELSTSGSVSIRHIVSSTHPELIPAARSVASSARFTPPTKNGKAVKAIMRWPIVIQK
jgi:periplasmic protein TonB